MAATSPAPSAPRRRRMRDRLAAVLVTGRWLVLLFVAGAVAGAFMLPSLAGSNAGLSGLVGLDNPTIRAQVEATERFGLPLLSRVVVVQHDPGGLDPFTQADTVLQALEVARATIDAGAVTPGSLALAYPLVNSPLLFPGIEKPYTTVVTYLFIPPPANLGEQDAIAQRYAAGLERPDGGLVGVTGTIPIQVAQGALVIEYLPLVELATLAAIGLIVGLHFRSVVAPVLTLAVAAVAYLLADRVIGALADLAGIAAPSQLQPIVIALLLGITTDYSIFFLSGLQRRLREGEDGRAAARGAVAEYLPIVGAAGLTVAAGVGVLVVAESALFQAFGPGLAITVIVGLAVATTMLPALLAILGPWTFWPAPPRPDPRRSADPAEPGPGRPAGRARPTRLLRAVGNRGVAGLLTVVVLGVLVVASLPLSGLRASVSPVDSLPSDDPVRLAAAGAADGFAPGIVAPTALIVSAPGLTAQRDRLAAFEAELEARPGIDAVLGPGDQPFAREFGLFLAPDGGAARLLLIPATDPLAARAVDALRELRADMPGLLADVGLGGAEVAYAGDTALGLSLVDGAANDLVRVAIAVVLVDLLLLVVFLRALVAPLYLLATSVLAVGAALGSTVWFFQDVLGRDGITFYVPFAAAVLLVSLGSDYNIFSVGYIWEEARHRPLADALAVAVPRSTRAINAAGITLAVSFGLVALIPVAPFQELAFAVGLGVLIDAFVVRSLLVPALVSLVGRLSGWPGRRLAPSRG